MTYRRKFSAPKLTVLVAQHLDGDGVFLAEGAQINLAETALSNWQIA